MTIGDLEPEIVVDDDGKHSVTLSFTNLTDERIALDAAAMVNGSKCGPWTSELLEGASVGTIKVDLSGCKNVDGLRMKANNAAIAPFPIKPTEPKDDPDPEWDALSKGFGWGGVLSLVLVVGTYLVWVVRRARTKVKWGVHRTLPEVGATWSFKDNWATDITAFGALFTGIFGVSSVADAILGKDAEAMLAMATVGAAIAVALVLAGPLIVLALKRYKTDDKGKRTSNFTIGGVMLAAVVVLTSAFGQLYVIYRTGQSFEMDGLQKDLAIPFITAAAILVLYTVMSLFDLLIQGTTPPAPSPVDPTADMARVIARPLWAKAGRNAETEFLKGPIKDKALKAAVKAAKAATVAQTNKEAAEKAAAEAPGDTAAERAAEDADKAAKKAARASRKAAQDAARAGEPKEPGRAERTATPGVATEPEVDSAAEMLRVAPGMGEPLVEFIPYPAGGTSPGDDEPTRSALL